MVVRVLNPGAADRPLRHRYGLVLCLVLAAFTFSLASTSDSDLSRIVAVALQGAALIVAVQAAGESRHLVRLTIVLVAAALAATLLAVVAVDQPGAWVRGVQAALSVIAPIVLVRGLGRLIREEGVGIQAVYGALAIYVLLGMFFSFVFGLYAELSSQAFFAQPGVGDGSPADRLYFSFETMTTVGFGDLTASSGTPRALTVLEAILGQLYLVTVVSLVVSNLRWRSPGPDATPTSAGPRPNQAAEPGDS